MRVPTSLINMDDTIMLSDAIFFSYFRFTIHNRCYGQDSRKGGWAAVPWVTHRGSGPMRIVWRGRILIFYFKEFGECQSVCSRRILHSECETCVLLLYRRWPVTRWQVVQDAEHCSCLTVCFWFGVMMHRSSLSSIHPASSSTLGVAAQNIPPSS